MAWQVVAGYAAKAFGSYFGGKAKKKAARRKAGLMIEEIELGRDWALTDLGLEDEEPRERGEVVVHFKILEGMKHENPHKDEPESWLAANWS